MSIPFEEETYSEGKARRDEVYAEVRAAAGPPVVYKPRMQQLLDGEIGYDDLDDDELMRGQLRNVNGTFSGRGTNMIPRKMQQALVRRILERGAEKVRADFFDAIEVIGSIAKDESVDPSVRLKAAGMIVDRIAGKTPERVELSVDVKPWEQTMESIYRPITDAEVVDADVDDGDDG